MNKGLTDVLVLFAENDDDDYLLACEAMREACFVSNVKRVCDGEQLIETLRAPASPDDTRRLLIILDLNMPRKDGREALREIKADPTLRRIPVVVMTTSSSEDDLRNAYALGVSSFINKPVSFQELVDVMKALKDYWLDTVTVPPFSLA